MDPRIAVICEQVAEGKTIRQIAASLDCSAGRVLQIITEGGEEAAKQYARARDLAADLFEADIYTAAEACTPETAQADRVRIDALKWIAARRAPKRYSERLVQEVSGPDGGPIKSVLDVSGLPTEVLSQIMAAKDASDKG